MALDRNGPDNRPNLPQHDDPVRKRAEATELKTDDRPRTAVMTDENGLTAAELRFLRNKRIDEAEARSTAKTDGEIAPEGPGERESDADQERQNAEPDQTWDDSQRPDQRDSILGKPDAPTSTRDHHRSAVMTDANGLTAAELRFQRNQRTDEGRVNIQSITPLPGPSITSVSDAGTEPTEAAGVLIPQHARVDDENLELLPQDVKSNSADPEHRDRPTVRVDTDGLTSSDLRSQQSQQAEETTALPDSPGPRTESSTESQYLANRPLSDTYDLERPQIRDEEPDADPDRGNPSSPQKKVDNTGKSRSEVEPNRYEVHPEDSEKLTEVVEKVGRENCRDWIDYINPRFPNGKQFQNNCGDCSRSFATTSQTDAPVAAAGDRRLGEGPEMWEWSGVLPTNTLHEDDSSKIDEFQAKAWEQVVKQLEHQPPGTVAIVGVDWAPIRIGNVEIDVGGHWFNAHVTTEGIKWADAQTGKYNDWPPTYSQNVQTVESIYRRPGETDWRP